MSKMFENVSSNLLLVFMGMSNGSQKMEQMMMRCGE